MNSVAKIPLSGGKSHAVVDASSEPFIGQWEWSIGTHGYALRTITVFGKTHLVWMHRVICCAPEGVEVDHINGDPLDNRSKNLRLVTRGQNLQNRGRNAGRKNDIVFKGVYKNANCATYTARLTSMVDGKKSHVYLGSFTDQESAARAYDLEAHKRFGDHARLNFPIPG
jgi:hypothetical protein